LLAGKYGVRKRASAQHKAHLTRDQSEQGFPSQKLGSCPRPSWQKIQKSPKAEVALMEIKAPPLPKTGCFSAFSS
jgi:hypothetical protein